MTASFTLAVIVYSLGVGTACAAAAIRSRPRSPLVVPALAMVELAVVVQAGLDVLGLARGDRPGSLATHVGYLVTSVALLPIAAGAVQLDEGRWGNAGLAIGCVLVAVVSVRLHQTLGAHG